MELPLTSSPSPSSAPSSPSRPSVARPRARRQSLRKKWEIDAKVLRGAHRRLGARGRISPQWRRGIEPAAQSGFGIMAVAADRKSLRDGRSRRRRGRVAIFLAHRLSRAGRRRAGRGRASSARPLCDVLDWRGSRSDRRGPRRGAWIFRALQAAFLRSGVSRLAGGIGLGGAVDSVDALSGRGRPTSTQAGRPARRDNVGGGGAARERSRDRPLPLPHRRDGRA